MPRFFERSTEERALPTLDTLTTLVSDHLTVIGVTTFVAFGAWRISRKERAAGQARKILDKAIKSGTDEPVTLHPEIDPARCAGCGSCTVVCPEGDILKIIDHRAVLVAPTKCVGHGECEAACPTKAITLVFGTKRRGMDIPRITGDYETNVPGLYIAGELGGMGLIRNAVKQGHLAAKHAIENMSDDGKVDADLFVVGAGPAGLSASLTAIASKKSYLCIEQNSLGGTVYNYPRQKIVMVHPVEIPIVGRTKFPKDKVSKEELLGLWSDVRAKTGLTVRERVKFETLSKVGDIFEVVTSAGTFRAKKVILCTGVRGSPRRLGLPNEDLPKVAYNLIDAEQYQNQDVAVVGSGNAAAEAVQLLAKAEYRNRVTMLIRGPDFDRCNDENKELVLAAEKQGRVRILYESQVSAIEPDRVTIKSPQGEQTIGNQFLFIFAGAEMPHKYLMSLGVQIEKRFGTALKRPDSGN